MFWALRFARFLEAIPPYFYEVFILILIKIRIYLFGIIIYLYLRLLLGNYL
jgi:hypothetical protein